MFKNINPIAWLFIKAIALYLLWYLVYEIIITPESSLDLFLNHNLTIVSVEILKLLGYDAYIVDGHIIGINTTKIVSVGSPCNGLILYALYIGFLLVMQGSWKNTLLFSLLGVAIIYIINVLRIVLLTLNILHNLASADFNHKYVYQTVVYAIIFFLWHIWIKKYANFTKDSHKKKV